MHSTTTTGNKTESATIAGRNKAGRTTRVSPPRPKPGVREWLIERARQRIEEGFYDDPLIVEAAICKAVRAESNKPGA